jgi:ribose/xylose/arabinose/galactoside ABC-type transport system permease subunit
VPPMNTEVGSRPTVSGPASVMGSWFAHLAGRGHLQVLGVYLALAISWIALAGSSSYFLTLNNIRNLLVASSTVALIAAGLTLVMIAGEIDLSFAAMQAFAGSLAAVLVITHGLPWVLGGVIAIVTGTVAGVISGVVTVAGKLATFVTTLAMMGIVQGVAYVLTSGQPVDGFPHGYAVLGTGLAGPVPISVIVVAGIYVILHIMLTQTRFGLNIFAVGGNSSAAERVGISPGRVIIAVLALSGFLASVAGIMLTSRLNAGSGDYGGSDLLPAIAGVIIGGTSLRGGVGSLVGTLGGVLVVETINDGLTLLNVSQFWQQVAVGVIIMLAVVVDQGAREYFSSGRLGKLGKRGGA